MFSKIRYQEDPALDSIKNNVRGAEMEIICKDGTRASIRVPLPVGEPENPARRNATGKVHGSVP